MDYSCAKFGDCILSAVLVLSSGWTRVLENHGKMI